MLDGGTLDPVLPAWVSPAVLPSPSATTRIIPIGAELPPALAESPAGAEIQEEPERTAVQAAVVRVRTSSGLAHNRSVHVVDLNGVRLRAEFSVEPYGGAISVVLASAGGSAARDYNEALALLLRRLAAVDAVLIDAFVESSNTRRMSEAERRLVLGHGRRFPIHLRSTGPCRTPKGNWRSARVHRSATRRHGREPDEADPPRHRAWRFDAAAQSRSPLVGG